MPAKPVPEELKSFTKTEVSFFLDRLPAVLKVSTEEFFKTFGLYVDGVLTQYEFYDLVTEMLNPNSEEQFK